MWVSLAWLLAGLTRQLVHGAHQCEDGALVQMHHVRKQVVFQNSSSDRRSCPLAEIDLGNLLDSEPLDWLTTADGTGFIQAAIDEYVGNPPDPIELPSVLATGAEVNQKPECKLPLKDLECYLSPNAGGWQDIFIPKNLPFAEVLQTLQQAAKELGGETCMAANQNMFGIYDSAGYPSRASWTECMCPNGVKQGPQVVLCPIQILLKGFAFGRQGQQALQLDSRQGNELEIYDGFVVQTLPVYGDAWVAFDLIFAIPPFYTGLECDLQMDSRVKVEGIFFASYSAEEEVYQIVAEKVNVKVPKILAESPIGTGVAALRVSSSEPDCRPTGFFAKFGGGSMELKWEDQYQGVLQDLKFDGDFYFGFVTKDSTTTAFFIKVVITDFKLLGYGFEIDKVQLEIQYVTREELMRRTRTTRNCCSDRDDSTVDCPDLTAEANALNLRLAQLGGDTKAAFALYVQVKNLNIANGLIKFSDIFVSVLTIVGETSQQLTIEASVKGQVRNLVKAEGNMRLALILPDNKFNANIRVKGTLSGGDLGGLVAEINANAVVVNYNLLGASWDFDLSVAYKTPEWLEKLAEWLQEFFVNLYQQGKQLLDSIVQFAEDTWKVIVELGKNLGEAVQTAFRVAGEAIDFAGDVVTQVAKTIQAISDLFKGNPNDFFQGLGDAVKDAIAEIGDDFRDFWNAVQGGGGGEFDDTVFEDWWEKAKKVSLRDIDNIVKAIDQAKEWCDVEPKTTGKVDKVFGCEEFVHSRRPVNLPNPAFPAIGMDPTKPVGCPGNKEDQNWNPCDGRKDENGKPVDCTFFPDRDCVKRKMEEFVDPISKKSDQAQACDADKSAAAGGAFDADGTIFAPVIQMEDDAALKIAMPASAGVQYDYMVDLVPFATTTIQGGARVSVGEEDSKIKVKVNINVETQAKFEASLEELGRRSAIELGEAAQNGGSLRDRLQGVTQCSATCETAVQLVPKVDPLPDLVVDCTDPKAKLDFVPAGGDFRTLFPGFYDAVDSPVGLTIDVKCRVKELPLQCTLASNVVDACASDTRTYKCFVTDCCGGKSNEVEQKLIINRLPSKFTSPANSLDLLLQDCTTNVHPDAIGKPAYMKGCPDTEVELLWNDEESFDEVSCRTTVVRTWQLIEKNCREQGPVDTFVQTIVLEHKENPLFETFPEDVTIDVFAPYGTDSVGFPTSYSVCSSPVTIDYVDAMKKGSCFAERVLERTFTSKDVCGKTTARTQRITIGTPPERLPLGPKSSYWLYAPRRFFARSRRILDYLNKGRLPRSCSIDAKACGGPSQEDICDGKDEEFEEFEDFLVKIGGEASLDKGSLIKECRCPVGDETCEILEGPGVVYGPRIIKSSGVCASKAEQAAGINRGQTLEESPGILLKGSNAVYNFFTLDAKELSQRTVAIDCPATSIVVTNLEGSVSARVAPDVRGIVLQNQITPSHVLFNVPGCVRLTMRRFPLDRKPYTFQGSLLDRRGSLNIFTSIRKSVDWIGQIYSKDLRSRNVNFQCGHFAGFASCASWPSPSLVQLNASSTPWARSDPGLEQ